MSIKGDELKDKNRGTCHVNVPAPRIDDTSIRFTGEGFCEHCGKKVDRENGTFCRSCDDSNKHKFVHCHNCGSTQINVNSDGYNCHACGYYA